MTPAQREQLNRVLVVSVFALLLTVGVAQAGETCRVVERNGCLVSDCGAFTGNCAGFNYMPASEMDVYLKERSGCYQKMQEVIRRMKARMHPNPNSRSLTRGFIMTEEVWTKEFEPIYRECVQ